MVEWKKLGEIGKCMAGATPSTKESSYWDNGTIPWMSSGEVHQGVVKSTSALITQKGYDNSSTKMLPSDTVVIALAGQGKTRGTVAITAIELCTNQSLCGVVIDNDSIINKYVYYYLKTRYDDLRRISSGEGTRGGLNLKMIGSYLIPVPSLSEQKRIVGILDTFTSSIENLKEQIALRRKQYEYYRDQLLDLEGKEGVERYILKDVCEVINGRAYSQPELLSEGKYRVLRVGNFFSNDSWYYSDLDLDDKYYCEKGDLLYAWSASFGPHIWVGEKTIYHYHIWKMNCSDNIDKMFMYYWLQSENMRKQAFSNLHGATMAHLTKLLMESLKVPVPPLKEQQRIVSILDTFEASIQNLEAQLSQREKQYEYYRNKLLTFE